jgi:hypothetical protein
MSRSFLRETSSAYTVDQPSEILLVAPAASHAALANPLGFLCAVPLCRKRGRLINQRVAILHNIEKKTLME